MSARPRDPAGDGGGLPTAPAGPLRIALAGEALIDFVGTGPLAFQGHVGGAILNSAVACARLGQPTAYLTQLSTDLFGEQILAYLQANGVDTTFVTRCAEPQTLAFVERTPTTNRYVFLNQGTADTRWAPQPLPALPESCRFLHYGSISLLREPAAGHITALVAACRSGRCTVFDPNMRPSLLGPAGSDTGIEAYRTKYAHWLGLAELLKLSDEDAALLAPGTAPDTAAAAWLDAGPQAVVLTRGGDGATLYRRHAPPLQVRPPAINVADTIGAGDTFTAALSVGLLERGIDTPERLATVRDEDWQAVMHLAATAAALNCTREGCDPPTREALARALASR